jgi:hypothetical protein
MEVTMAKATRSLSPKLALERMQRHRHAVMVLAMQRAKKAVLATIRAKGQRIADFSAREIALLAEDYLAQHGEQLRVEAEEAIATWPGFAPWRYPVFEKSRNRTLPKRKRHNRGTNCQ